MRGSLVRGFFKLLHERLSQKVGLLKARLAYFLFFCTELIVYICSLKIKVTREGTESPLFY